MAEVRACVYFSVIFLCFQITAAKPFFGLLFCDILCDDDDVSTTTTSTEDYFDSWCDDCPTRRPRPTTTQMPPAVPNPMMPGPGAPPMNIMMPPGGGAFSFGPDPNRWFTINFSPYNPAAPGAPAAPAPQGAQPPAATPAPVPPPTTAAGAAPAAGAATTAAPAAAAAPAAPAAPAARK